MSGPARVGAFAVALAALFAAAAAVGNALGPLDRGSTDTEGGHAREATMEPSPPAANGISLTFSGRPPLAFRMVGPDRRALRSFDVLHERRMHLIAVRNDLAVFHHVHPTQHGATWVSDLALEPGAYTVFADFSAGGRRTVSSAPLNAPGEWSPKALPAPATVARTGPYAVMLDAGDVRAGAAAALSFRVERSGEEVAVDPYLGAQGHLVILREGDLAYVHTHAEEDELAFETTFPSAGRYRAFLQLSVDGAVRTTAFTIEVPA